MTGLRNQEADAVAVPEPGRNCWRIERAGRAALIVDAADYFHFAREAMLRAKKQILLIGWDFDTRIDLVKGDPGDGAPTSLGPFITWLAENRPELQVYILKWDVGAVKLLGRGTTILRLARWAFHERIHFRLDGAHARGASHHQKIIVIDDQLAYCGGIDMTGSRWDTRAHEDEDPRRKRPFTGRHYAPWHDAAMAVDGDAAKAVGELARARWAAACGEEIAVPECGGDPWPDELVPGFHAADVAIARTRGENGERSEIREIEALFVDLIRSARRFIYAETQFFASRVIAQEMARRLSEPDGPEIVVVNPKEAELWLEEEVMGPARAELMKEMAKADPNHRFRIYTPVTEAGADIYVHAKIMIVDDKVLRVGSANLNNRSMGLDSECDVAIDARCKANAGAEEQIAAIRTSLVAEHLGLEPETVAARLAETGSLIRTIESLRGEGRSLVPLEPREPNAIEKAVARSEVMDPEHPDGMFSPGVGPDLTDEVAPGKD